MDPRDFLTDLEVEKIMAFQADATMREAVRKVLLAGIYYNGTLEPGTAANPAQNFLLTQAFEAAIGNRPITDEELGQQVRGLASGIRQLEVAFKELSELKVGPKPEKGGKAPNPGM